MEKIALLNKIADVDTITNPALGPGLQDIAGGSDSGVTFLQKFISNGITLLLIFGSVFFFFMLVVGAIEWITSGGDKGKVEMARGRITNALIGTLVLFAAWAIVSIIGTFFGTDIIHLDFENIIIK